MKTPIEYYLKIMLMHILDVICSLFTTFSPIYINSLNIKKLWREYKVVSNTYIKPKLQFSAYRYLNTVSYPWYKLSWWRIFEIKISPLQWKPKYDDMQFEDNPYVYIRFLNNFTIQMTLHAPSNGDDGIYWESILMYMYDNKCAGNIYETYKANIWTKFAIIDDKEVKIKENIILFLKDGYKEYISKCEKIEKEKDI